VRIVIPDDAPAVMGPSPSYAAFRQRHAVDYHATLPGSDERLIERIAGAEVVINIRSSCRFTASVMEACPNLKLISIWGTGTDNVDLAAAQRLGIRVTNTPGVAAPSIAEHTLALLLAAARRVPVLDARVRAGEWPRGGMVQLTGKRCGVIGLGAIGSRFARLAQGIGMNVAAWSFRARDEFTMVSIEELLTTSDVVSLHLRLSEVTRGWLSRERLALMKPGAIFVNTARGAIVDEPALIEALRERRIAAAGLDVFETEPLPAGHAFTGLDNVVLSPHCAGITPETLEAGLKLSLDNVEAFLNGNPRHAVV
jgi:phosphoglycerate dehydrogenase-like enzyme